MVIFNFTNDFGKKRKKVEESEEQYIQGRQEERRTERECHKFIKKNKWKYKEKVKDRLTDRKKR